MFGKKKAASGGAASPKQAEQRRPQPTVADVQIRLLATRDYAPPPTQPQAMPLQRGREYILIRW